MAVSVRAVTCSGLQPARLPSWCARGDRYVFGPSPTRFLDARQAAEAGDLYQGGLKIVSCRQYGKQDTADWLPGESAGIQHAQRGWQLHTAADGPIGAPIYASIDEDPTFDQYRRQVAPFLRGWERVIGHQRVGVYANSKTIEWALQDGLGSYFWQHNWRSPGRVAHPAAHLHQVEIDKRKVAGSEWTSTTFSSRVTVNGTKTYRLVSFSSKPGRIVKARQESSAQNSTGVAAALTQIQLTHNLR